jgi:hypothetical protein
VAQTKVIDEEARKRRRDIPDWLVVKTGSVQWEVDVDHTLGPMHPASFVDWRGLFSAMFGLEHLEPSLQAWIDLIHPEDIPQLTEMLIAHLSDPTGEAKYDHDYRAKVRLADGTEEWQWFNARGSTHWEDGKPQYIAGTLTNINKLKLKEFREAYEKQLNEAVRKASAALLEVQDDQLFGDAMHRQWTLFKKPLAWSLAQASFERRNC